jgi:hypothetical protein
MHHAPQGQFPASKALSDGAAPFGLSLQGIFGQNHKKVSKGGSTLEESRLSARRRSRRILNAADTHSRSFVFLYESRRRRLDVVPTPILPST